MATARVNGIEIDYEDTGRGRPLLLTHGHMSSRSAWRAQHEALGDRYRVISWDLRGHGRTVSPDDPAQYSLDLTVADVRALLGHLGIDRAVIGGLSLGGYVSLAFTLAHPEMVDALVVCDSGPGYRNDAARARWNARAFARAAELEAERRTALAHATRGILAQEGSAVIDGLPSIGVPTLVIVGDEDVLTPKSESQILHDAIRGSRLEVIEHAGHVSNMERPAAFNHVLSEFIASLDYS